MVKHRREFVRARFSIAQIRSAHVTGKKGVSGKQSGGNAGFEHTETDAVRRMTGCFDHLNLHCSQDEAITVFKVAVDECRGSFVGNKDRSVGSSGKLGVARHEIGVRMSQKDAAQF